MTSTATPFGRVSDAARSSSGGAWTVNADFFPRLPTCPRCGGRRLVDETVSGAGTVYSWVRVHRALGDTPVVEPPYVVATIDLDDGCRMFGRIEPHQSAAIGLAVTPAFVDHDGWTELVFAPGSPQ